MGDEQNCMAFQPEKYRKTALGNTSSDVFPKAALISSPFKRSFETWCED